MPNGIGFQEILLIALLVLLLFGPKGVAGIMRDMGRWVGKMKKYRDEFTRELMAMSEPEFTPEEMKKNERARIRKLMRKVLAEMAPEQREKETGEILSRLEALPEYGAARRVFCFAAKGNEVDTLRLMARMLTAGKEVFIPWCIKETRGLGVAQIRDITSDLEPGAYGVPEPKAALRTETDPLSIDLFLVPGLGFDHEMTRLGRGAGYFDRFLREIKGKKPIAGLCFDEQVYTYSIPREEQDISPDLVITPLTVIRPRT
jgi:5-formyltetrahydrofolate cyclo-ligase